VLLPVPHEAATGAAFSSAVNQIALVFNGCEPVLEALKAFHESIVELSSSPDLKNTRLLEVFKAMAKHLSMNTETVGENFFLQAFSLNPPVAQPGLSVPVRSSAGRARPHYRFDPVWTHRAVDADGVAVRASDARRLHSDRTGCLMPRTPRPVRAQQCNPGDRHDWAGVHAATLDLPRLPPLRAEKVLFGRNHLGIGVAPVIDVEP
jgi:hypothetical protein